MVAVLCHRLSELFGAQGTDTCTLQEVATWCEEQYCTPSSEVGGCRSFGEYHCREPKNEMHQHSPHHIEGPQVSASASHFSAEIGELGRSHKGAPHDLYGSGSPPGLCDQYGHDGQSYDSWGVIVLRAKQVKHLKVCCVGVVVCPHQEEHLLKCVPAYSCPWQEVANSQSDWSSITSETDPCVLLQLLVDWLWTLKVHTYMCMCCAVLLASARPCWHQPALLHRSRRSQCSVPLCGGAGKWLSIWGVAWEQAQSPREQLKRRQFTAWSKWLTRYIRM